MRTCCRCVPFVLTAFLACAWQGQDPGRLPRSVAAGDDPQSVRLPDGKSQRDEILKAEREQNIKDSGQLVELAQQLQVDLEKNDRNVLSLATLKKIDEIDKLARKIRSRLRHN